MNPAELDSIRFDVSLHRTWFQELLELGRETLPQRTSEVARRGISRAAEDLRLEVIEKSGAAPTFLLLSRGGSQPELTIFGTWHAEAHPVHPAATEGAERLALLCTLGSVAAIRSAGLLKSVAVVIPPAATIGSLVLEENLKAHRGQLQAPAAFWARLTPTAPRRRRVFLGSRGRVVLGIWGEGANAYAVRDRLIADLSSEAYGPRPLDFELLRKLGQSDAALEFLEEGLDDPDAVAGEGEGRLKNALFEPRGTVARPPVRHPDRPQAWLTIEIAESMDPRDIAQRAQDASGGAKVEMVEAFPWDRQNIHHPAIQAQIQTSKTRSEGAEIWPSAPWVTPSGLFTRALGTPLAEWGIPLPTGTAVRFPKPESVESIEREMAELFLRGSAVLDK